MARVDMPTASYSTISAPKDGRRPWPHHKKNHGHPSGDQRPAAGRAPRPRGLLLVAAGRGQPPPAPRRRWSRNARAPTAGETGTERGEGPPPPRVEGRRSTPPVLSGEPMELQLAAAPRPSNGRAAQPTPRREAAKLRARSPPSGPGPPPSSPDSPPSGSDPLQGRPDSRRAKTEAAAEHPRRRGVEELRGRRGVEDPWGQQRNRGRRSRADASSGELLRADAGARSGKLRCATVGASFGELLPTRPHRGGHRR